MKPIIFASLTFLTLVAIAGSTANCRQKVSQCQSSPDTDTDWDDRVGPVESIRVEDAEMFYADKPLLRQISKFNREGQKIETVLYRDDGVALPKSTYSYDSSGRLIKAHHYQVNGTVSLENTYTYSSDGSLETDIQRNLDDNKILSRKVYSYESKRKSTTVSEFDWDAKLRGRFGFIRDDHCRIVEIYGYYPDGSVRGKAVPFYDTRNNIIESTVYSNTGTILERIRNDYEFDERGNWIKQVASKWVSENGKEFFKPEHVTIRKFTYY